MSSYNFKCGNLNCGGKIHQTRYSLRIIDGEKVYFEANKEIRCAECGFRMNNVSEFKGFCTNYGSFESMTPDQRAAVLDKRSHEHYLKEIHERKIVMNREAVTKFNNL